jgi:hypothetical protein
MNSIDVVTTFRQQLLQTGFHPLPLFGKAPSMMKNWPTKLDTNAAEIVMWGKQWPDARNTGILTKFVPTLDIDILNPEAVETIKRLVIERFEERGSHRPGTQMRVYLPLRHAVSKDHGGPDRAGRLAAARRAAMQWTTSCRRW